MEITLEDLIGATITDALDDAWIEATLPDGRVIELSADAHMIETRDIDKRSSFPVGRLVLAPQ